MKVFISWSGSKSGKIAIELRDWIPMVLQYVQPWLSSTDIPQGSKWASELEKILNEVDYGIICLTKENLNSKWLNFEAGAISKNKLSKVIVFLVDVTSKEIEGPLAQFQSVRAEKGDLLKLIYELNNATEHPLKEKVVDNIFEILYPNFESALKTIQIEENKTTTSSTEINPLTTIENKVDQILEIVKVKEGAKINEDKYDKKKLKAIIGKPKVFIGSSTEGLEIGYAIQENLGKYAEVTIWNQNVFSLSETIIESIVDTVYKYDFAIIIFTPDDTLIKRGVEYSSPRDNVIFELGLFIGTLGRGRTFLVYDADIKFHIPSDISGVTAATFSKRTDKNLLAALMPVCQRIKRAMGVAE